MKLYSTLILEIMIQDYKKIKLPKNYSFVTLPFSGHEIKLCTSLTWKEKIKYEYKQNKWTQNNRKLGGN